MAIRNDTDELIAFLNSLVKLDPHAITMLVINRVFCNEQLGSHPTVQTSECISTRVEGEWQVGLLGILNGYCGIIESGPKIGYGPITGRFNDKGLLVGFERTNPTEI